jgi:Fur family ferric uptake transcriptional regulator
MAPTETWTESALSRLREASGRRGGARRLVVELLGEQVCCLSAQEIHDRVRARGGRVGIASVYRALDLLVSLRLVQRIDFGAGVARYEPVHPGGDHHHHLVCGDCGKVVAFEDERLEGELERLAGNLGYVVDAHEVVLRGACGDCAPAARRRTG